jgi:phage gp36-like protein
VYATAADLQARYPERDLIELTDPQAEELDPTKLERALADAAAEIDGYLQGRYVLPLQQPPKVLALYACDIAMYRLMTLRRSGDVEDARSRYDDAIRYLRSVSKGEVQLGISDAGHAAQQEAGPELITAPRRFSRDSMHGL